MPNFPIEWWQIGCVFYQLKKIKNHYIIFFKRNYIHIEKRVNYSP
jgi:hypothetical protein